MITQNSQQVAEYIQDLFKQVRPRLKTQIEILSNSTTITVNTISTEKQKLYTIPHRSTPELTKALKTANTAIRKANAAIKEANKPITTTAPIEPRYLIKTMKGGIIAYCNIPDGRSPNRLNSLPAAIAASIKLRSTTGWIINSQMLDLKDEQSIIEIIKRLKIHH